jgi:hypothetical protein
METGRIKDAPATENLTENQKAKVKRRESAFSDFRANEQTNPVSASIEKTSSTLLIFAF